MIRLKNEDEINGIRRSCHLLADMFNFILPQVKPGMTTKAIDTLCHNFMTRNGGRPAWFNENFPGAVCISVNEEVIHGVPSRRRVIQDGDLVSIDAGIDLEGFISDSTHTVLVGKVRPEHRRLDEVTLECLRAGIGACRAGNRISDIAKAVNAIAEKNGYGVVYEYTGHGVGLEVHEDPSIPNYYPFKGRNPRIQAGMVLAIEPMISLGGPDVCIKDNGWTVVTEDGKWAAHEEHTVAVFSDHTEILTDLNYAKT